MLRGKIVENQPLSQTVAGSSGHAEDARMVVQVQPK
jgi:hypothetical protein